MAASQFNACCATRADLHTLLLPPPHYKAFHFVSTTTIVVNRGTRRRSWGIRAQNADSYLDMWKTAKDRERKAIEFQKIAENSGDGGNADDDDVNPEVLEKKIDEFKKILEVPKEERDRIQKMQVIDRAAAAIAAAQALLKEIPSLNKASSSSSSSSSPSLSSLSNDLDSSEGLDLLKSESNGAIGNPQEEGLDLLKSESNGAIGNPQEGMQAGSILETPSKTLGPGTPGPDFWSWTPPDGTKTSEDVGNLQAVVKPTSSPNPTYSVVEKERTLDSLPIPFESTLSEIHNPPLPPLQSLMEVEKVDLSNPNLEVTTVGEKHEQDMSFSVNAAEAVEALNKVEEASTQGVNLDGSKWWKETGIEQRPDGVLCRWTLTRGVSADQSVEWEDKFWEAVGEFDYKELGSEKSGRDATGNVWREYWKESMWQDRVTGVVNMEKTADKWGKNGVGGEWHEKWWEHYDATGQAEKWAHKYCSIDPNTPLEAGHAHVWHERWGEKYDGMGGSVKYTDKWAERSEGDGWSKWGDKWDENFDPNGHGVKQGETWWQGKYGERWNRTWGEGHNGSGWVHKYGKSSSGEHWDTHEQQDTWYERYPHFGFDHCFENSVQLREFRMPPETS